MIQTIPKWKFRNKQKIVCRELKKKLREKNSSVLKNDEEKRGKTKMNLHVYLWQILPILIEWIERKQKLNGVKKTNGNSTKNRHNKKNQSTIDV